MKTLLPLLLLSLTAGCAGTTETTTTESSALVVPVPEKQIVPSDDLFWKGGELGSAQGAAISSYVVSKCAVTAKLAEAPASFALHDLVRTQIKAYTTDGGKITAGTPSYDAATHTLRWSFPAGSWIVQFVLASTDGRDVADVFRDTLGIPPGAPIAQLALVPCG